MRHILTSVVLVVLLFPSLALGETMDDLFVREGHFYKKFTDVPFTGTVTGRKHRSDGRYQGKIKNGKKEGPWVEYYYNGQLSSKGTFKDGEKEGPWVDYHYSGQLWSKVTYKDGDPDGPWVSYHDNGQLSSKGTFKDGEKEGPWVHYSDDGTVDKDYTGTYRNGEKVK